MWKNPQTPFNRMLCGLHQQSDAMGRKVLVSARKLKEPTALKITKPAMPSELHYAAIYKLTKKPTRIYCL
jgi:hypothetical protein